MPDRPPDPLRAAMLRLSRTIAANELHPQDAFEIAREEWPGDLRVREYPAQHSSDARSTNSQHEEPTS